MQKAKVTSVMRLATDAGLQDPRIANFARHTN